MRKRILKKVFLMHKDCSVSDIMFNLLSKCCCLGLAFFLWFCSVISLHSSLNRDTVMLLYLAICIWWAELQMQADPGLQTGGFLISG